MKNVLVTGFEPFGRETVNPSALAAQALDGRLVAGRRVAGAVLPCVFGKSLAALGQAIRHTKPELVICVGQAGGGEILVWNVWPSISRTPAFQTMPAISPWISPVVRGGPAAYWSTLPIKAIVVALWKADLPAVISQSAGTFVCNHVFYGLMRALARKRTVRGGFIHVPFLPEQARRAADGSPSLSLDEIVRGLEIAIETSLTTYHDLRAVGGAVC